MNFHVNYIRNYANLNKILLNKKSMKQYSVLKAL
jgi:hypothetical protein